MSAERTPWWYSGGVEDAGTEHVVADTDTGQDAGEESQDSLDWTALAVGAQRLVDWASERLLTPHAEHTDPRANPGCVVCRTQLLLGESGSAAPPDADPAAAPDRAMPVVEWIPIVDAADPVAEPLADRPGEAAPGTHPPA